jgi:NTE family protein
MAAYEKDISPLASDDAAVDLIDAAADSGSAHGQRDIALALSGGGVRAMAFHLGVLRFLAERGMLERISKVSTVSGGSLVLGLILEQNGMRWPASADFHEGTFAPLRATMCDRSLAREIVFQMLLPRNWRFAFSRANIVAGALRRRGIAHRLKDLPVRPEWAINGTSAETGRRFRFRRDSIGDWSIGYAYGGDFPLADAMAVSAAFPGLIGPLALDAADYAWRKRLSRSDQDIACPFKRLHLYDGGVYDNLGLESFFDAGRQESKIGNTVIYASDAGAPLDLEKPRWYNLFRVKRLAAIMAEQSRALRVRAFYNYIDRDASAGAYVYIGTSLQHGDAHKAQAARGFPTGLSRLTHEQFDLIAGHGYEVARGVEHRHGLLASI